MIKVLIKFPKELQQFYQFLSIHSILLGLFPILLPSYLWMLDWTLSEVSLFIAFTGIGFILSLLGWLQLYRYKSFKIIVLTSFLAQLLLISAFFLEFKPYFLIILAMINGFSSCFFFG